ncbi:MAG: hypothetical protein KC413_09755 [Anaerolineales bacterium]|nr:hypothetical protein [Anaerolineales bacterium]
MQRMAGLGVIWAGWMLLSCAYSLAQDNVVAPLENVSLPINIMWGFLIWQEIPTWVGQWAVCFVLGPVERKRPLPGTN